MDQSEKEIYEALAKKYERIKELQNELYLTSPQKQTAEWFRSRRRELEVLWGTRYELTSEPIEKQMEDSIAYLKSIRWNEVPEEEFDEWKQTHSLLFEEHYGFFHKVEAMIGQYENIEIGDPNHIVAHLARAIDVVMALFQEKRYDEAYKLGMELVHTSVWTIRSEDYDYVILESLDRKFGLIDFELDDFLAAVMVSAYNHHDPKDRLEALYKDLDLIKSHFWDAFPLADTVKTYRKELPGWDTFFPLFLAYCFKQPYSMFFCWRNVYEVFQDDLYALDTDRKIHLQQYQKRPDLYSQEIMDIALEKAALGKKEEALEILSSLIKEKTGDQRLSAKWALLLACELKDIKQAGKFAHQLLEDNEYYLDWPLILAGYDGKKKTDVRRTLEETCASKNSACWMEDTASYFYDATDLYKPDALVQLWIGKTGSLEDLKQQVKDEFLPQRTGWFLLSLLVLLLSDESASLMNAPMIEKVEQRLCPVYRYPDPSEKSRYKEKVWYQPYMKTGLYTAHPSVLLMQKGWHHLFSLKKAQQKKLEKELKEILQDWAKNVLENKQSKQYELLALCLVLYGLLFVTDAGEEKPDLTGMMEWIQPYYDFNTRLSSFRKALVQFGCSPKSPAKPAKKQKDEKSRSSKSTSES